VLAANIDDIDTVEVLVAQPDINVDATSPGRKSALMVAASSHNSAIATALLAHGADARLCMPSNVPDQVPDPGWDALDYSFARRAPIKVCPRENFARRFLQQRPRACTPMFLKYVKRHLLLEGEVAAFVEHDSAVVNQRDDAGLTPLHVFVYNAMSNFGEYAPNAESADFLFKTTIKITKLLIFNGADATAKTSGTTDAFPIGVGLSPIDVARTCGQDGPRRAQLIAALGGSTEPSVAIAALGGSTEPAVASMDLSSDE
jgi:ankyrin repeat protein